MSQNPSTLQSFFAELKRRRVFRVMAVYGATAFVLLQVADLLAEGMGLSDQVLRITTFVVLIGFPIAVVLAWAFETTPDGVKRTTDAAPAEISAILSQPASKRWPAGLLALAGMALLFWGGWWMGNRGAENPANIIVSEAQAADFRALAVLPFENVNETEENGLIAAGVHRDLLSQMQRIAALRVTSPTSVREYENTQKTPNEIADELGVEFIMEGSVQSAGSQVRVTVTLVDPSTNEQLWNHQYDKEVTPDNLFQIQSEVARSVVSALEAELTPQDIETLDKMAPASSLAAQSWYHRGIETYSRGSSEITEAIDALTRAVELDPEFVAAWSYLTQVLSRNAFIGVDGPEPARIALERTLALAPGSVEAHLATGYFEYYGQRDFDAALAAFHEAERLAPSDSDVVWAVGLILRRQGEWDASNEMMKQAVRLDPRNALRLETLIENLNDMGAYGEADAVLERHLAIHPTNVRARRQKVVALVDLDGNTDRARRLAGELGLDATDPEEGGALALLASLDRDHQRVVELTRQIDTRGLIFFERPFQAVRASALYQMGDPSAATVADSLLASIDPETMRAVEIPALRAHAHSIAGRREEALSEAREADRIIRRWDDHVFVPRIALRVIGTYGRIGELEAGLDLLEEVLGHPNSEISAAILRLVPFLDPYRGDPRFDDLIRVREAFEAEGQRKAEAGRPWLP